METIGAAHRSENILNHKYSIETNKTPGKGKKKNDEDAEESFIGRHIMETIGAAHRSENIFNPKHSIKSYSNNIETVRPKLAKKEEKKKCFDEQNRTE